MIIYENDRRYPPNLVVITTMIMLCKKTVNITWDYLSHRSHPRRRRRHHHTHPHHRHHHQQQHHQQYQLVDVL